MNKEKGSIELDKIEQELNDLWKENIEDDYSVSSMEEVIVQEEELIKRIVKDVVIKYGNDKLYTRIYNIVTKYSLSKRSKKLGITY